MGTYVYALNTKVRTISNVTVGVAEYRYKEHTTAFNADELNLALYNSKCKRRVEHFLSNKLPFYFVRGKIEVGAPVYNHLSAKGRLVGSCFDDSTPLVQAGTIKKVGRSYEIDWI